MNTVLSRIILFASDVEQLKLFYQQHFAFTIVEEIPNEWVVLNAGQIEIAFHRIGEAYRNNSDQAFKIESNTKLVFKIVDDIEQLRSALIESGVPMTTIKSYPGFDHLLCDGEDPEGNVFQLMAAKR
ncbi:VOC family protein [Ferruginibacter sp. SUN106]|uniref:VOC family protein n=1 Tax=Ferruginibacter sp. SUN106 TaxID=2978348 RepID=UPI003D36D90B